MDPARPLSPPWASWGLLNSRGCPPPPQRVWPWKWVQATWGEALGLSKRSGSHFGFSFLLLSPHFDFFKLWEVHVYTFLKSFFDARSDT